MPSRRRLLAALAAGLAGCAGGPGSPGGSTDESPESSPSPSGATDDTPRRSPDSSPTPSPVTFPDGPKAEPTRPDPLTRASAREYVRTYEYRYAYNTLHEGQRWDVNVEAAVTDVRETDGGYRVHVRSSGYAERGVGTTTPTATPVHADWGRREFVYLVTPEETRRGAVR